MYSHVHHEAHTRLFIDVLFVITQKGEQLRNPKIRDWRIPCGNMHTMEHYIAEVSKRFV